MPTKHESAPLADDVVFELDDVAVHFQLQGSAWRRLLGLSSRTVKAVDGISLTLHRGEVLGLVGESGSGKTTLGRALLGMAPASRGTIVARARSGIEYHVSKLHGKALRQLRTDVQMVFQDPHAALNPSMTIEAAVGDPLVIHGLAKGAQLRAKVANALERVGLSPAEQFMRKYPADLSGGQKQRAVLARSIILDPEVLVADEPVSMLDMSVRAKILQLMLDLKNQLGLTYVYITHDLATAKYFCDRVAIMYLGRIVEIGPTEEIFAQPRHPYTQALLKAIPEPDPERAVARDLPRGEIPDAAVPPLGCSFHPRCPVALAQCGWEARDLKAVIEHHWTTQPPEVFASESVSVGPMDPLEVPATTVRFGKNGAETVAMLERIRRDNPAEPMWQGVVRMEVVEGQAEVEFHPHVTPELVSPESEVQVACVLHPAKEH